MNFKILHGKKISYNMYSSVNFMDIVQISENFKWYNQFGVNLREIIFSCLHSGCQTKISAD